ncbi:MAG: hypothetical protein MUD08_13485 [Cytophagales bacterium]|jgi:hypothetical protein|nr:hypothetical protein [Cytophagales bacterium]
MYATLLAVHSFVRWLVLLSLLYAIVGSYHGWFSGRRYVASDAIARVAATTLSHTQLLIGFTLYFVSPITQYFLKNTSEAMGNGQISFFGVYHITLMLVSVVVMTIGSSLSKRADTDLKKFKLTAIYFTVGLVLIACAIPWFRPLFRSF